MKNLKLCFLVVSGLVVGGSVAHAGPPELLNQLAIHPTNTDRMVLRYKDGGSGLLYSQDGGTSWQVMCASAMVPPGGRAPTRLGRIALASDDILFLGTFTDMLRDDGQACGFDVDSAFSGQWISDVVNDPLDPTVLYAVTATTPDVDNGLYRREAGGSWEPMGEHAALRVSRLHVVPRSESELRFYVTATRDNPDDPMRPFFLVRVSDDRGATWEEHEFDPGEPRVTFEVEAVDPSNPDRLLASVTRGVDGASAVDAGADTLWVSTDAGATFTEYLSVTDFGGADIAPDGRVFIGDLGDTFELSAPSGLYAAASVEEAPAKIIDGTHIACVNFHADLGLFACQRDQGGWVDPETGDYTQVFDFNTVESTVSCEGVDLAAACREQFLSAYCGASHFPTAGVCCPYAGMATTDTSEGGMVAACEEPAGSSGSTAGTEGGMGGTGGASGGDGGASRSDGGMAGAGDGASGTGATAAGAGDGAAGESDAAGAGDDGGGGDDGGCSCAAVGLGGRGFIAWLPAMLAAIALLRLRRRRA